MNMNFIYVSNVPSHVFSIGALTRVTLYRNQINTSNCRLVFEDRGVPGAKPLGAE